MTSEEKVRQYVLGNYSRYPVWPVRGEGAVVWDRDGKSYLDFAGGVAVCPLGHAHPAVTRAISEQAATLIHVSNWYGIEAQGELAELLVERVAEIPGRVFFCNSGAEANEGLIKLARRFAAKVRGITRPKIITFHQSFHGRTTGAMFATGQEKIWGGFGFTPEEQGFIHLPYNDVVALENAFSQESGIAAVLLEAIQGESGVNAATPEFLRAVQALCRKHDALLLLDEVQSAFGRAGEMSGWRAVVPGDEIQPDGISWAKAIGSGFPLGAFFVRDARIAGADLVDILGPGTHGTTYGGSPLACAAGLASTRTILYDDLCANARKIGEWIESAILSSACPGIKGIRRAGLFIGIVLEPSELNLPDESTVPSLFLAGQLLEAGLMTVPAGPGVIRWLPPLTITAEIADQAVAILRGVLTSLSKPIANVIPS